MITVGAVTAAAALPAAAVAQTVSKETISFGPWKGSARYFKASGRFSHCAMTGLYKNGDYLAFVYDELGLSIHLGNKAWAFAPGGRYPVTLSVDDGWRLSTDAVALPGAKGRPWIVAIPLEQWKVAFERMKRGQMLSIRTRKKILRFALNGTAVALRGLEDCYFRHSKILPGGAANAANPFGPARPAARSADQIAVTVPPPAGKPAAKRQFSGADVQRYGAWSAQAHETGRKMLSLIELIDQINDIARGYIDKSVTEEFARKTALPLLVRLRTNFALASASMERLGPPPAGIDARYVKAGRNVRRFLGLLRDQIESMIGDTQNAFELALSGDKSAYQRMVRNAVSQRITLLRAENVSLATQSAVVGGETPLTNLNNSYRYGNTALIQVLSYLAERLRARRAVDESEFTGPARTALRNMESEIAAGLKKLRTLRDAMAETPGADVATGIATRLWPNLAESFEVEREIAGLLREFARSIFGHTGRNAAAADRELLTLVQRQSLELEVAVNRRQDLTARRLAIVASLK